MGIHKGIQRAL